MIQDSVLIILIEDFWGGYVEAHTPGDDGFAATIRNCRIAGVAFMRHGQLGVTDESFFRNVLFEDIQGTAVTLWANDGVDFHDCQFRRCGTSGILSHGSQIDVTSGGLPSGVQNFSEMDVGIDLAVPSIGTGAGSRVVSNRFRCEEVGVEVMSSGILNAQEITNNRFLDGERAINVRGESNYEIGNNTFENQLHAIFLLDGKGDSNPIDENSFKDAGRGCLAIGDNSTTEFEKNCFEGSEQVDILNLSIGSTVSSIRSVQGSSGLEAGNCFTENGIPEIANLSTARVDYHLYDGLLGNEVCKELRNSIGVDVKDVDQRFDNLEAVVPFQKDRSRMTVI